MIKCEFAVSIQGSAEAMLARAKKAVVAGGGHFEGDDKSGSFYGDSFFGDVKGEYENKGTEVVVRITDKPFGIPCSLLERKIRAFFA